MTSITAQASRGARSGSPRGMGLSIAPAPNEIEGFYVIQCDVRRSSSIAQISRTSVPKTAAESLRC